MKRTILLAWMLWLANAVTTTIRPVAVWLWVKPAPSRPGWPRVAHVDDPAASSGRGTAFIASER